MEASISPQDRTGFYHSMAFLPYFGTMKWKELEDYDWFPPVLRRYQMQNIGIQVQLLGFYGKVAPILEAMVKQQQVKQIIDLCSGSGFPAIFVRKRIADSEVVMTLTDKFPQPVQQAEGVHPEMIQMDILALEPKRNSIYTMFNAFHHFESEQQAVLLKNVADNESSLLIVEILKPNLWNIFLVSLASTLGVWVFFWWIKPFEWRRFVLTYILPINVLTVWFDGIISIFKSKSARAYRDSLKATFKESGYRFEVFEVSSFPTVLTILKITPHNV